MCRKYKKVQKRLKHELINKLSALEQKIVRRRQTVTAGLGERGHRIVVNSSHSYAVMSTD